ncbi:tetratricopeptide repeat protein [Telluribacter sp.]|jgi:tetratricopeptide (TPR) repeat protein|uniref:tetratricopeptide repeat protein n=1 Tax=Telluribacter sp. TaxID=1978767 RepID=UPI002E0E5A0A|nr:tetratricopeptide repeat protein [Telluribacter sp.]
MENPFLKKLLVFYEEDPQDPFNIYALALEYQKTDLFRTETLFRKLLAEHPGYLPTYYHAAQLLADAGKADEARATYEKGIDLARQQANQKTLLELERAYRMFQDDQEDW